MNIFCLTWWQVKLITVIFYDPRNALSHNSKLSWILLFCNLCKVELYLQRESLCLAGGKIACFHLRDDRSSNTSDDLQVGCIKSSYKSFVQNMRFGMSLLSCPDEKNFCSAGMMKTGKRTTKKICQQCSNKIASWTPLVVKSST